MKKKDHSRLERRLDAGFSSLKIPHNAGDQYLKDIDNMNKTNVILRKERNRRNNEGDTKLNASANRTEARDALNRHIRRHPGEYIWQEFGIFSNVSFI